MTNKCEKCGAPIGGFWAKLAKLWGVKRSSVSPDLCNKCAPGNGSTPSPEAEQTTKPEMSEATTPQPPAPSASPAKPMTPSQDSSGGAAGSATDSRGEQEAGATDKPQQ